MDESNINNANNDHFAENADSTYSVGLDLLIKAMELSEIYMPENKDKILVSNRDVNRPGLALSGFYGAFDPTRIQIMGLSEHEYLKSLSNSEQSESLKTFFASKPICVITTNNLTTLADFIGFAKEHCVPILSTGEKTSAFIAALIAKLNLELAPRIARHGVFVEIYGEGVLILGESGIGKSETAVELVKRGHRLIADDMVEIKKVSAITLVGSAPEIIRHYIEIRGIGVVDVRRIFGMGAVKMTEKVDLVINMQDWVQGMQYERFGLEDEYIEIMGIKVPSMTIPVKPGRNLAIILEIAAMNNRQKKMGYNAAAELNKKLMDQMGEA